MHELEYEPRPPQQMDPWPPDCGPEEPESAGIRFARIAAAVTVLLLFAFVLVATAFAPWP